MLYKDVTALRLSLSWSAIVLGYAFIIGVPSDTAISQFMSYGAWALVCLTYGGFMWIACFFKLHRYILCAIDAVGIWIWVYLFLCFTILSPSAVSIADVMLITPILTSLWLISDRLFKTYIYDVVLKLE